MKHYYASMQTITYQVSGLSCNACVNRVKNALSPYAEQVEVTLNPPRAIMQNPTADLAQLNAALKPLGHYQLAEASAENGKKNALEWLKKII
jgi:copper chaperone CopZ